MYNVVLHGSRATCPKCAGTMITAGMGLVWQCIDCRRILEAVGQGQTEGEMLCKEISRKERTA